MRRFGKQSGLAELSSGGPWWAQWASDARQVCWGGTRRPSAWAPCAQRVDVCVASTTPTSESQRLGVPPDEGVPGHMSRTQGKSRFLVNLGGGCAWGWDCWEDDR